MTIAGFRDWLATQVTGTIFPEMIDENLSQCMGVYRRDTGMKPQAYDSNTTYDVRYYKVIVHWTNNIKTAESKADEVASKLNNVTVTIGGKQNIIQLERQPVMIGRTDRQIWQYVVLCQVLEEL